MSDFVTIETMSRLYYRATVLDARDGVEVMIWRKCPGGAVSLTRREQLPDGDFETVVERLTTASRWL